MRFSLKRNLDLLKALTSTFKEEQLNKYYKFLHDLYTDSPIEEHYPKNQEEAKDEEEKEEDKTDENMRRDLIKTFALNQLANFP